MGIRIDTVTARAKLPIRADPYWQRIRAGLYLGYRKASGDTEGTWLARYRSKTIGQQWHSLGHLSDAPPHARFDRALSEANAWVEHLVSGGVNKPATVLEVCIAYARKVGSERGAKSALDLEGRYKRCIAPDPIGKLMLADLTRDQVRAYRQRLVETPIKVGKLGEVRQRSLVTVNRDIAAVRVAFNQAFEDRVVNSDHAWRAPLKAFKNVERQRELYLDREQRKLFLQYAAGELRPFLQALSMVPLRPGALAALKVADFEPRLGVLNIGKDKTGKQRKIKLPDELAKLFHDATGERSPGEPLFIRDNGLAWNKDAWKYPLKDAARAAGLPEATVAYTLRHCAITDLVHAGVDLLTVAQLSGTSVRMIELHYGHLRDAIASSALLNLVV